MTIRIEGGKLIEGSELRASKKKRPYFTFRVHIFDKSKAITVSGWKYFPDEAIVSTPSVMKGQNKFVNTTRTSKEFYNVVVEEARRYFADWEPTEAITEMEEVKA